MFTALFYVALAVVLVYVIRSLHRIQLELSRMRELMDRDTQEHVSIPTLTSDPIDRDTPRA